MDYIGILRLRPFCTNCIETLTIVRVCPNYYIKKAIYFMFTNRT